MKKTSGPKLDHLERLCSEHGIIQFSRGDEPDLESGFCLDDNVRLLAACVDLMNANHATDFARRVGDDVFQFILEASATAPNYHNMMDRYGRFTDRFASPESIGRLIRALGLVLRDSHHEPWRALARTELQRATAATAALSTEHARAFAVLGFAAAVEAGETSYRAQLRAGAEAMLFELGRNNGADWYFPMRELSYDVARIPEALIRAGDVLGDPEMRSHGVLVLEFVESVVQPRERFEPIGAPKWYLRRGPRPYYSQQPLEALAMMDAWMAAGENDRARVAYEWFLGNNLDGIVVADLTTGGCRDAIHAAGVINQNMGAESTLAYVQAALNSRMLGSAGEIVA